MTISEIAQLLNGTLAGSGDAVASDVTHDSRNAGPGTIFAAIKGQTVDGHRFLDDVIRRGAVAIISEQSRPDGLDIDWIQVENTRHAMAVAASAVFGDPSEQIDLVGITGTNGKTTTTYLAFALALAGGRKPAMLTTVEYRIGDVSEEAVRTTPEASDTNRFLRRAITSGCDFATMEASSQAIDLNRCDGLRFRAAVFTNLTQDHLDYHVTMENYFDAKKKLFDGRLGHKPEIIAINIDDEWGRRLVDDLSDSGSKVVTFALDRDADLTAMDIEVSLHTGTTFTMKTGDTSHRITSPLVGRPHVYNMLSATAVALELGIGIDAVIAGLEVCIGAPGRFERVPNDLGFAVVVDYAHTDDALANTLRTARELTDAKIITVFGCGGDRDVSKRFPMGRVAGELSDVVIVTSDNPRNEDPLAIIANIEEGIRSTGREYVAISDRREAIAKAVAVAEPGDVVIIAGKGHETYQIIGSDKFHFDDREAATDAIRDRAERS